MATYSRIYENINTALVYSYRGGSVQKPINRSKALDYNREDYRLLSVTGDFGFLTWSTCAARLELAAAWDRDFRLLEARCYDSIYRQASGGARASAALTLLEWESSFGMIAKAARAIAASAYALRRGDIIGALRELNIRSHHSLASRLQRKYDNGARLDRLWLEINFGWSPLVDDIRKAIAVLSQSVPTDRIRSSASGSVNVSKSSSGASWSSSYSAMGPLKLRYTSSVSSVNPNVLLAKQLGLTNLAQVAWDFVPFSFVVDWFLPINKFLSSFDLSLGISLAPVVVSKSAHVIGSQVTKDSRPGYTQGSASSTAYSFKRYLVGQLVLPSFSDRLTLPSGSLWQATTSVALATQQLLAIKANSHAR